MAQQEVAPTAGQCALEHCSGLARGMWQRAQGIKLTSKFPFSDWASVGHNVMISVIHFTCYSFECHGQLLYFEQHKLILSGTLSVILLSPSVILHPKYILSMKDSPSVDMKLCFQKVAVKNEEADLSRWSHMVDTTNTTTKPPDQDSCCIFAQPNLHQNETVTVRHHHQSASSLFYCF